MKLKDKFFKNGFIILNLFSKKDIDKFNLKIKSKLNNKIKKNSNKINNLEEFHKINFTKNESNYLFKSNDRFIKIDQNIKKKISKNKTINDILLSSWKHNNYLIKWVGS